jgi:hypothetical protein
LFFSCNGACAHIQKFCPNGVLVPELPQLPTSAPTPPPKGELGHAVSPFADPTPVVVLPSCMRSCPGFQAVLASELNCQALAKWADLLLNSNSDGTEPAAEGNSISYSNRAFHTAGSWTWTDLFGQRSGSRSRSRGRRLDTNGCMAGCGVSEKRGIKALSGICAASAQTRSTQHYSAL